MLTRVPIPPAAERRIRREARSETLRERALALRQTGWTFASIGKALGVSTTRALQMVRRAELIRSSKEGAPATGRPSDSTDPFTAGQTQEVGAWIYNPPPT